MRSIVATLVIVAVAPSIAMAVPRHLPLRKTVSNRSQRHFDAVFAAGDHLILVDARHRKTYDLRRPEIVDADTAAITTCGLHVAFTAMNNTTHSRSLFVADAPDFVPRQVGAQTGWHESPHFSPDGNRLVFAFNRSSHGWDVHVPNEYGQVVEEDLKTGRLRVLTDQPQCHLEPSYSADGTNIFLDRTDCAAAWRIMKLNIAASTEVPVTRGWADREASPSPGGKRLAFVRRVRDGARVMLANLDGSNELAVTTVPGAQWLALQWVEDGHGLAWRSRDGITVFDIARGRGFSTRPGGKL